MLEWAGERTTVDETLRVFWEAMCNELLSADELLKTSDNAFNRRTFVRTSFAAIEGIAFTMKSYALSKASKGQYSNAELALLREESFTLGGEGKVLVQQKFLPIESNVRFAFAMFARALGKEHELDCSGHHWHAFKTAVAVRNRIVHPKTPHELRVSDDELAATTAATRWLINSMMSLALNRIDELNENIRRFEEQVAQGVPLTPRTEN